MPAQMNARLGANAMVAAETTPSAPPNISVRRRPSKSAAMPLGTSHSRLTPWKTPSARPICASVKPRAASSATQTASVKCRVEVNACRYTQRSCFCKFMGEHPFVIVYENVPLNLCKKAAKSAPRQSHRAQKLHTYSVTEVKKGTLTASVRQGFPFFWNTTPNCQRIRGCSPSSVDLG